MVFKRMLISDVSRRNAIYIDNITDSFLTSSHTVIKAKEWLYEYHIFELRKYELDRKKIIAVIETTFAVAKRKPEKKIKIKLKTIQACTGFEP